MNYKIATDSFAQIKETSILKLGRLLILVSCERDRCVEINIQEIAI